MAFFSSFVSVFVLVRLAAGAAIALGAAAWAAECWTTGKCDWTNEFILLDADYADGSHTKLLNESNNNEKSTHIIQQHQPARSSNNDSCRL